jgi:Pentapeptide repeats (8 copies)
MRLWKRLQVALLRLGMAGLVIAFIAGIVAAAYFASVFPDWTGFGPPLLDAQGKELPHAKMLWDWLGLLVPVVLAIGGFFLTRSENRYALQLEERREAEARKLDTERAQDAALQAYLDQMTQLLLHEKLRTSQPDDEVRSVARARTLTVLRVLRGVRSATVLQFLYEARLIGGIKEEGGLSGTIDAIVSLEGAGLLWANLAGANLQGANLQWTSLTGANLEGADLTHCKVTREQLAQALSLEGAKLPFDNTPASAGGRSQHA